MDLYLVVLRIIHIGSGVVWAGATFFVVLFLLPTVQAAGPEGGKFMQRLAQGPYPKALSAAGGLSVLSGLLLYWRDSAGLQAAWIATGPGTALTVGGIAGLIALAVGVGLARLAVERLGEVNKTVAAAGGPPSPDQMAEIQRLQSALTKAAGWTAALLALTVVAMAAARYL